MQRIPVRASLTDIVLGPLFYKTKIAKPKCSEDIINKWRMDDRKERNGSGRR